MLSQHLNYITFLIVYKLYYCIEVLFVGIKMFAKYNMHSIFTPIRNQCDTCTVFEVVNVPDADYQEHIAKIQAARDENMLWILL